MNNLLDQIKADREAGTPGPWAWEGGEMVCADGKVIDHVSYEGMWFARYDEAEDAANARRIARVPDMEAALLAAGELADAAGVMMDQCDDGDGYTEAAAIRAANAIAAFRKAIEVK